jgi:chorismate mutase
MRYEEIDQLIEQAQPIKILRARTAPLLISFLYAAFKTRNRITIPSYELTSHLSDYLEQLKNTTFVLDEKGDTLTIARKYIDQWCSEENRYLTRYPDENGEPMHELTPAVERVFQWLESLQKREFVGTESRFKDIFRRLQELIDNTSDDPKRKIQELEAKRQELKEEIAHIKKTGKTNTYNDTQIKERFFEISKSARELTADFKEVEQNFKDITLNIYKKQTQRDLHKGDILGYALDATEELKNSDQGKSFYAFWQFLIAADKQDELILMIEYVYQLLRLREIDAADNFLKKIKIYLHTSGQKVINSNHLLADKLSRILVEKEMTDRRRSQELMMDIKNLAVQKIGQFAGVKDFIEIEGGTNISMDMDRPWGEAPQIANFVNQPQGIGSTNLENANFGKLFDQFELNKQELERAIAKVLGDKSQMSLRELTQIQPINKGLEEVITYFSIAAQSSKHKVDSQSSDTIEWLGEDGVKRNLVLPRVIFLK